MLRTTQERIKVAQNNIYIQIQTAALTNDRYNAGLVPELDVKQAKINLANTKAQIPSLQQEKIAYINRIAVLLGGTLTDYQQLLDDNQPNLPIADVQISSNLSGNLLRRRPDIRKAERQLAAQTELIGVAQADLYPSFNIIGSFTYSAVDFDDLTDNKSRGYSFGPSFRWNLFDANRIRNNIKIQQAKTRQYQIQYEKTVLTAIEEVQNSLTAYLQESVKHKHLDDSAINAQEAVILVKDLYENGLTDFQNVLDSQRTLFNQQDRLTISSGQKLINIISVYKALGGGWQPND
jgi:NodT family efflux transporter outer membrane factor (OMF) lipoprotein